MKRSWKIYFLILAVVFVGLSAQGTVLSLRAGKQMGASVEQFLVLIKNQELQTAYQSLAREFQSKITYEEFSFFLQTSSLQGYKETISSRGKFQVTADPRDRHKLGIVQQKIKTKDGTALVFHISMRLEESLWKITSISSSK